MITIRSDRLVPETGTGPKTMSKPYYFDQEIRGCWAGLTGYRIGYASSDHEIETINVELSAAIRDTEFGRGVVVETTLLLRDQNGDDAFSGWVDYVLFVDLADGGRTRPPIGPRELATP